MNRRPTKFQRSTIEVTPLEKISDERIAALRATAGQMLGIWGYPTKRGFGGAEHRVASSASQYCRSCGVKLPNSGETANSFSKALRSVCSSVALISVRLMTAVRAIRRASASNSPSVNSRLDAIGLLNTESRDDDKGGA